MSGVDEQFLLQMEEHKKQEQELLHKIAMKSSPHMHPSPVNYPNFVKQPTPSFNPLDNFSPSVLPGYSGGVNMNTSMENLSDQPIPNQHISQPFKKQRSENPFPMASPSTPYNEPSPSVANRAQSHALNRECATHLAQKVLTDLSVLIQFMDALDTSQFPHSVQHLHSSRQAMTNFINAIQEPMLSFRDEPSSTNLKRTTLDDFTLLDTIGTGTFGRVKLCRFKPTNEIFCIKILSKEHIVRLKQEEHVMSEKNILLNVKHPFIVNLYTTFQTATDIYFVMEYVSGGELFTAIKKFGGLDPKAAKIYAAEIILVIEHLHQHDYIHRDLKPENLLIDKLGHLKLTDFGFAKHVPDRTWTMCGTPEYIAPEILQSKGHGRSVDWWSLGILIYEMLVGHPPFQGDNSCSVFKKILTGELDIPLDIDPVAADLISRLLIVDLTRRLGCMCGGVDAVKNHAWFAGIDWNALFYKHHFGPIHPKVTNPQDTSNFYETDQYDPPAVNFSGNQDIFKDF